MIQRYDKQIRRAAILLVALAAVFAACGPQAKQAGKNPGGTSPKDDEKGTAAEREKTTLYQVEAVDAQTAYAWGTNDEGFVGSVVLKTSDGGAHWRCVLRTGPTELIAIDFVDASNGVAVSDGGAVYATSDGGATWNASNDAGLFSQRYAVVDTSNKGPYVSVDGIVSVAEKELMAFGTREESSPDAKPGRIVTVTRPLVLHTTDGGTSWKDVRLGADVPNVGLKRAFFADAKNGWVVGGDVDEDITGVLLRTTDGGATWTKVTPNAKQVPEDVCFVDATHGWTVGATEDDSGDPGPSEILVTTDGGATWTSQKKVPASLRGIRMADAQNGWAVGSRGKIFRTTDGGATWTEQTEQDWTGGQQVDITDPVYPSGTPQPTFTWFVLVAPGHGWASGDLGIYEYRAK